MKLFDRSYRLKAGNGIDSIEIDGTQPNPLQIDFIVDQTPNARTAWAEITIYGLSRESEIKFKNEYDFIQLDAGYGNDIGSIFIGKIVNADRGREGADHFVTCYCKATAEPSSIVKSWGENTPQLTIIRDVAASFGYPVEIIGDFSRLPMTTKGKTLCKNSYLAMDILAADFDFHYIISNSKISVIKNGAKREDQIIELSGTRGMVGTPKVTLKGVDVTARLIHRAKVSGTFQAFSELGERTFGSVFYQKFPDKTSEGVNRILSLRFVGNYYGDDWNVELEGIRL